MIYQCPNCASALIYDPEQNCLICHHCDSTFVPEEIETNYMPKLRMKFHIYSCTACGAEIMVTENEAATFCIYCGQPVIVFDRVSSELQPDYIIPFKTTREAAHASLRYSIRKKFFVPKEFKNFKPDTLRGIYIPFWLYDIDYTDRQYYSVKENNDIVSGYFCQKIKMNFKDFPVSASLFLDDEEIQALGKFYLEEKEPFNSGYLSGFYADRYTIDYKHAKFGAIKKAEEIFDFEAIQSLYKKYREVMLHKKFPNVHIRKTCYVLLPIWFITFQYKNKPYTLYVNGQTGCPAGNLPIHKGKAASLFIAVALAFAPFFKFFAHMTYLCYFDSDPGFKLAYVIIILMVYILIVGLGVYFGYDAAKDIVKRLHFSRSKNVQSYVTERQDIP